MNTGLATPSELACDVMVPWAICEEELPDIYIQDGNVIQAGETLHDLAFITSPGLNESGGREAARYLDDICGNVASISFDIAAGKSLVDCNGVDASLSMIVSGHGEFDDNDCSIREFIDVLWTEQYCSINMIEPVPETPDETPKRVDGLVSQLTPYRITVGHILGWETNPSGQPETTITISCLFPHYPSFIDAAPIQNGGVYDINLLETDIMNDYGTAIMVNNPIIPQPILFDERLHVSNDRVIVYNPGPTTMDKVLFDEEYKIDVILEGWENAVFADPENPTAAEREEIIFVIRHEILSQYENNECSVNLPVQDQENQRKIIGIAGSERTGALTANVIPWDATCSETVTITSVISNPTAAYFDGFNYVSFTDMDSDPDTTIPVTISNSGDTNPVTTAGLAFRSNNFTIGENNVLASGERVNPTGLAIIGVDYLASGDDTCTWTQRE